MKEAGMETTWRQRRLGDILTLQYGKGLPQRERRPGPYPVIGSGGIIDCHESALVKGPGIVVGRKGSIGTVYFSKKDFYPIDTVFYVQLNSDTCNMRFVYYLLLQSNLPSFNSDAAVPGLNRNVAHSQKCRVPVLSVQHKIAAILSAYDDLIENNLRRIKILEEIAQMIYREWFAKFRFPGHEKVRMVDSGMGMIPEGWEVKSVRDVATLHRGKSYRGADLTNEGGLPFLNLKCIERGGGFRLDGLKRYKGDYESKRTARPGDIIIAVTDMTQERRLVAHVARVPHFGEPIAMMSMDLVKAEPRDDVAKEYLHGMFRFSGFSDEVKQHANGVNVLHLNPERIEEYEFPLPPPDLRRSYAQFSADVYKQCDTLHMKNINLHRTRDLLLPKLISGELDVSELDIDIGEEPG